MCTVRKVQVNLAADDRDRTEETWLRTWLRTQ